MLGRNISLEGAQCWEIYVGDINVANTLEHPDCVSVKSVQVPADIRHIQLKKYSVTLLKVKMQ